MAFSSALRVGFVLSTGFVAMACGSSSSSDGSIPSSGPSGSDDGGTPSGALDGSVPTDGGSLADGAHSDGGGGDGASPEPPVPTVGSVTGFAMVLPFQSSMGNDVACTTTDCYFAAGSSVLKLPHGATSATPLPALPANSGYIANIALSGAQVFAVGQHNTLTDFVTQWAVFGGGTWQSLGVARSGTPVVWASLTTDGTTVWSGEASAIGGGFDAIAVSAGPTATFTKLPSADGTTENGRFPTLDKQGTLWGLVGLQLYRLKPGEAAWTKVGAATGSTAGRGRRLRFAPNGDLWLSGTSNLLRLAAGASTWTTITLPGLAETSSVIIDGSNTAYLSFGEPSKLLKVAPGATTATDTGVVVASARICGATAIDGAGKLLFTCSESGGGIPNQSGLYRSLP